MWNVYLINLYNPLVVSDFERLPCDKVIIIQGDIGMTDRQVMIDRLVGVQSSKRNYYAALKTSINEMKKKNTQLEIINDVMKGFNIEMSMNDMLRLILEKMQAIFSFKRLSLFELHQERDQLRVHTIYPEIAQYQDVGPIFPRERSLYWQVITESKSRNYIVDEADDYVEVMPFIQLNLKQIIILPMYVQGKIIGLFSLGSEEIVEYDEHDLRFFQQLTDQIAVSHENVRLYQEVLNKKNEWEQTFSAVMDPILLVDLEGIVVQANEAAQQYLQRDGDILMLNEILYGLDGQADSILDRCIAGQTAVYAELKLLDQVYCEVYAYPVFNEQGKVFHIIVYVRDITKKRQYEVQIMQSGKLAAIGEMAAGVAHELNNPLTAILGNAQLLLRKETKESSTYHLLHDIYECGKRSQNIIRNLLTFSRQDEYLFERCSVNKAVDNVLGMIGYQMRQQQIQVTLDLAKDIPLIDGSMQQIEQVIINFMLNAKDALEEVDRPKEIILETKVTGSLIYLSVHDNGIGMNEQATGQIFDPFFTTKQVRKGTGLGLSVSLGIAESHQGDISVASTFGKGSSFTLQLPLQMEN